MGRDRSGEMLGTGLETLGRKGCEIRDLSPTWRNSAIFTQGNTSVFYSCSVLTDKESWRSWGGGGRGTLRVSPVNLEATLQLALSRFSYLLIYSLQFLRPSLNKQRLTPNLLNRRT